MQGTNFHRLNIFCFVTKLGSFSKAAQELSLSLPAVSIQVRELEKTFGTPLLHRTRQGPVLTDTGRTVFDYAQRIFALADEMQAAVHDLDDLKGGRLSIGSSTTPGEYILPWVIGLFQKRYPDIEVSLSITNTQTVIKRIIDRDFDLGMAGSVVDLEGLASTPYVDDEIVIIASPEHELASKSNVTLADLSDQRFILRESGSATRQSAEDCLASHNINVRVVMEIGSNEALKRAVAAGLGLGMVSKFSAAPDIKGGFITTLPVEGWSCHRPITVFYRRDQHLPAAQRAFLRFLQDERPLPPTV